MNFTNEKAVIDALKKLGKNGFQVESCCYSGIPSMPNNNPWLQKQGTTLYLPFSLVNSDGTNNVLAAPRDLYVGVIYLLPNTVDGAEISERIIYLNNVTLVNGMLQGYDNANLALQIRYKPTATGKNDLNFFSGIFGRIGMNNNATVPFDNYFKDVLIFEGYRMRFGK